jgi:hypothetical protein
MDPRHLVETYKFWDVVTLWAKERIEAPEVIARVLARGVICDGLRINSRDPKWIGGQSSSSFELKGYPYVGYAPKPDGKMSILRIEALEHLLAIVRECERPSETLLNEEFIGRDHFKTWCSAMGIRQPAFWFPATE